VSREIGIDRIAAGDSELKELWDKTSEAQGWYKGVEDLRERLCTY
jgi:hypothetical protein